MKLRGATTYTLQAKGGISSSTIRRMKAGESVSTNTLEALCKILDCTLEDIVEYLPDNEQADGLQENPSACVLFAPLMFSALILLTRPDRNRFSRPKSMQSCTVRSLR